MSEKDWKSMVLNWPPERQTSLWSESKETDFNSSSKLVYSRLNKPFRNRNKKKNPVQPVLPMFLHLDGGLIILFVFVETQASSCISPTQTCFEVCKRSRSQTKPVPDQNKRAHKTAEPIAESPPARFTWSLFDVCCVCVCVMCRPAAVCLYTHRCLSQTEFWLSLGQPDESLSN